MTARSMPDPLGRPGAVRGPRCARRIWPPAPTTGLDMGKPLSDGVDHG